MGKKGCVTFILPWIIATIVLAIILSAINKTGQSMGTIIFISVILGLLISFCIFAFKMFIVTSKVQKEVKAQKIRDKQDGISRYNNIIHVGGLQAPKDCKAHAILSPSEFKVMCGGNEYVLDVSKIRNVDFQIDVDEEQYLDSSFVRGVIGAAAFGVSGAVIGSAPTAKTKRDVKCYAIISYESAQSEEGYKIFLLRDEYPNTQVCAKLVDTLKPRINQGVQRIEL